MKLVRFLVVFTLVIIFVCALVMSLMEVVVDLQCETAGYDGGQQQITGAICFYGSTSGYTVPFTARNKP